MITVELTESELALISTVLGRLNMATVPEDYTMEEVTALIEKIDDA